MRALHFCSTFALAVCAAALAACSPAAEGRHTDDGGNAGTGATGTGGAGGTGGGSGGAPTTVCGTSKPGRPVLRRLTAREFARSLEDVFPQAKGAWTSSLTVDSASHYGFDNDASLLVVSKQTATQIADTAESVATAVTGAPLAQILPCASAAVDAACAGQFLASYGKRLFRRPLTSAETASYGAFFELALSKTADGKKALAWLVRALIEAPQFVYRREIGMPGANGYELTPHEIAAELAYTYTGTTPTDDLLGKADRNELGTPAELQASAKALLTGTGREVVDRFFTLWLGYGQVTSVTKPNVTSPAGVPPFETLRAEMLEETRRFVQEVVIARNGGPRELLTANFTTPSTALAQFYGFPAPAGSYAVVARPPQRGVGVLSQGSLLTTRAQPNGSSPTQRGLLVFERLLCRQKPAVPANVPILPAPQPGQVTTRQRYENLHAAGGCATCHSQFDPIGFAFEQFDEAGRYRADDGGLPIDTRSFVPDGTNRLFEFANLDELANGLTRLDGVNQCVSAYLTTYAFGGPDACLGETRRPEFISGSIGFVDYLASLAAEPHFTRRQAQ